MIFIIIIFGNSVLPHEHQAIYQTNDESSSVEIHIMNMSKFINQNSIINP